MLVKAIAGTIAILAVGAGAVGMYAHHNGCCPLSVFKCGGSCHSAPEPTTTDEPKNYDDGTTTPVKTDCCASDADCCSAKTAASAAPSCCEAGKATVKDTKADDTAKAEAPK